ncbi:MAG TPA: fatty acid desaturase [Symbiobacteriaceae bacterium]|jgi:fatty acid desaturase
MLDLHPGGWYAARVAPYLPEEAFKPAPVRLWGGLAYLLLTAGGIAAVALLNLPIWANLLLAVAIGTGFAGLGFLGHEILHGTVVRGARLRDWLGAICFAQFLLGPKLWRKWHNVEHHGHTQADDLDPDAWATMAELFHRPALRFLYRLPPSFRSFFTFVSYTLFFSVHSQIMFRRFIREFRPRERLLVWLQLLAPVAFWLGLLAWMGPARWLFAYVLPLMLANFVVISYISSNHQLNPLSEVNDPLAVSLSVTVPRWVDVLHFNFGYHTEHHLFPGMNPRWAPLVKAELQRLWPERYHAMPMTRAMLALWRTPRIYHRRQSLVDPLRNLAYGTLGFGLDPAHIEARPVGPLLEEEKAGHQRPVLGN